VKTGARRKCLWRTLASRSYFPEASKVDGGSLNFKVLQLLLDWFQFQVEIQGE
jgi:hypothetical protein